MAITTAAAILGAAVIGNMSANKARQAAQREANLARQDRAAAQARFDKRIEKYEQSQYVPLDLDKLKTEDIFEEKDLTKDVLPAADYAREQFAQQQANIMAGLRGVAGASGIAGLAQSLSAAAKDQARETGITIGQQLAENRKLALQEKQQKQMQERQVILSNMQGKNAFELDKMATLLGVEGQRTYAETQRLAQLQQNQSQLQAAQMQMNATYMSAYAGSLGS